MDSRIRAIAQNYLDNGVISDGFGITPSGPVQKVSLVKWVGSLLIIDPDGNSYVVIYQTVRPIHADSSEDLNVVKSITTLV